MYSLQQGLHRAGQFIYVVDCPPLGLDHQVGPTTSVLGGYLDVLPQSATKEYALKYLQNRFKLQENDIVFAGDGGNDLGPLTSGYQAIVVNNASELFKKKVVEIAKAKSVLDSVYFAHGDFNGMNGNYTAGVLEGLNHFGFYE